MYDEDPEEEKDHWFDLAALVTMIKAQDFGPILASKFGPEHCYTNEGQSVCRWLFAHRENHGKYPTFARFREAFRGLHHIVDEMLLPIGVADAVDVARVEHYRQQMRKLAIQLDMSSTALDPATEILSVLGEMNQLTRDFRDRHDVKMEDAAMNVLDDYHAPVKYGIPYPWPTWTQETQGMKPGQLIFIVARPKMRKTFVAKAITNNAYMEGKRVLEFTTEMDPETMIARNYAYQCRLPYREFRQKNLNDQQLERLTEHVTHLAMRSQTGNGLGTFGDYHLVDARGMNITFIEQKIEEYEPDLVFVDSMYRMNPPGATSSDGTWRSYQAVIREAKNIASRMNVPLLATHQINREGVSKDKKKATAPTIENAAFSDAVGQDADFVMGLHTGSFGEAAKTSILYMMAGREVTVDGILIRNIPCSDFDEMSVIYDPDIAIQKMERAADKEREEMTKRTDTVDPEKLVRANIDRFQVAKTMESIPDPSQEDIN